MPEKLGQGFADCGCCRNRPVIRDQRFVYGGSGTFIPVKQETAGSLSHQLSAQLLSLPAENRYGAAGSGRFFSLDKMNYFDYISIIK